MGNKRKFSIEQRVDRIIVNSRSFLFLYIIYRLTLDYIYKNLVTPLFESEHFYYVFRLEWYAFSWIWLCLIIVYDIYIYKNNRLSSNFLLFLDMFFFIPLTSLVGLGGINTLFVVYAFVFWFIMTFFQLNELHKSKKPRIVESNIQLNKSFILYAFLIVVCNALVTIYYNGFHLKFDLTDVYDLRAEMADMQLPTLVGYLKPMASKLTIVLLMLFWYQKKYILMSIMALFQIMNFAFGAMKADLFSLIVAIAFFLFYSDRKKIIILYAIVGLNLIAIIEYVINGISFVSILIHRRMLFMPSVLSLDYFEYFSDHQFAYYRTNFLQWFGFDNPYHTSIQKVIGTEVYNDPETVANTGILGDDFAQIGWLSILIYPWLRVKTLHLGLDGLWGKIPQNISIYISFMFVLAFISGSFTSILLTGGYIVICILLNGFVKRKQNTHPIRNMQQ